MKIRVCRGWMLARLGVGLISLLAGPTWAQQAPGDRSLVRAVQVVVEGPGSPLVRRAAELLCRQIERRCGAAICTRGEGEVKVVLSVEPGPGAEGFSIEEASDGGIHITGHDERGLLYGVGKFLRGSQFADGALRPGAWRGSSAPARPVRGIYFGAFTGNYYCAAPLEEIRGYLEDLALWGCNSLTVVLPLVPPGADPQHRGEWFARQRAIMEAGRELGLSVGVLIIANGGPVVRPELRAKGQGRGGFAPDWTLCPSIPEAWDLLLEQYREAFAALADLELGHLIIWPYDGGGCDCEDCRPWGSNGFLRIARAEADLFREVFPKGQIVLSTWYFDEGEWAGLAERFAGETPWADFILADHALGQFPAFLRERGVPGGLPLLGFPEISMWDAGGLGPWGGFGANPAPGLLQTWWEQARAALSGAYPYSEGIFEDINKVIALQLLWSPERSALDIVREYAAFEFSPEVADEVVAAVQILEANGRRALLGQETGRYELREDAEGELRGAVRLAQEDAGAERAYGLLVGVDARLSQYARSAWRWRILLLRALIDRELVAHDGLLTAACEQATCELERIYHAQGAPPTVRPPHMGWLRAGPDQ